MTPKQIASFVSNAMVCRTCGLVFNSANHPHISEECEKGHADWELADQEMIAARLYGMLSDTAHEITEDMVERASIVLCDDVSQSAWVTDDEIRRALDAALNGKKQ